MSVGLLALLDDVAGLVKVAAASLDDIAGQAGKAGVKAVLVGETLMRAPDIGQKLRELRGG